MAEAKVFAFINYKGGVAKTTSAYHIGCWLSWAKNKNVLLIDIDPQTNLTFLCASIEDWERRKSRVGTIATMYKRYLDKKSIDTKKYIWKTPIRLRTLIYTNLLAYKGQPDTLVLVRNTFHGGMELQAVTSMKMKLAI